MLISAVQQLKSAKSHIYCSLFYTFSLFYILIKLCLLFLWIAFITRQFQKKKKKKRPFRELFAASSFSKVSQVTSQGLPHYQYSSVMRPLPWRKRTASVTLIVTLSCLSLSTVPCACRVRKTWTRGHLRQLVMTFGFLITIL